MSFSQYFPRPGYVEHLIGHRSSDLPLFKIMPLGKTHSQMGIWLCSPSLFLLSCYFLRIFLYSLCFFKISLVLILVGRCYSGFWATSHQLTNPQTAARHKLVQMGRCWQAVSGQRAGSCKECMPPCPPRQRSPRRSSSEHKESPD